MSFHTAPPHFSYLPSTFSQLVTLLPLSLLACSPFLPPFLPLSPSLPNPLIPTVLPPPLPQCSLDPGEGDMDVPFRVKYSAVPRSQHLDQLRVPAMPICLRFTAIDKMLIPVLETAW